MNLRLPPQGCPRRYAHDYPPSGRNSRAHSPRAMLMLNYQTNARNGALVRFNPAVDRDGPPASPHPGCPPSHLQALTILPACPSAHFQALTILPSPAFPSPPPTTLHFAPTPPPPGTMLGFATLVAFALPPCLISRRRHVSGLPAVSGSPSAPLRSPVQLQGDRPRLISGSARVSRRSVRARRPHLLSAEPSAGFRSSPARSNPASVGFGLARLVPDLARLNSGPAPLAFGVRSRVPIARPGFNSRPRTQIRPIRLPEAAR